MGRVTYEYGYRVALARFRARHLDADIEEDPFTIHLEDDLFSATLAPHCCQRISPISDSIDDPVGAFPVWGQLAAGPGRVADLSLSEHQVARLNVPGAYSTVVQLGDGPSIGQCSEMGVGSLFL
ncbi:hypothetical protein BHM03_00054931 [Ensete ventricosum]|nr:hypothetical protein BHM03_00054931 [Ensete ventricosum]